MHISINRGVSAHTNEFGKSRPAGGAITGQYEKSVICSFT